MIKRYNILLLLSAVFLFSSCKVIFTQKLRLQAEEQKINIEDIQFYTSKKIILQRLVSSSTVVEDTAKLQQTKTIELDRIKIKRNTPGVCVKKDDGTMEMIFEPDANTTLKFVLTDTVDPGARYKIGALRWDNGIGVVPYDSTIYYLQPRNYFFQPNSKETALKVKRRFLYKWKVRMRKLKGVKIEDE